MSWAMTAAAFIRPPGLKKDPHRGCAPQAQPEPMPGTPQNSTGGQFRDFGTPGYQYVVG